MIQKKLAIAAIALVAVGMTMSAIAPAMAQVRVAEYDCGGPDRKIILLNGATIRHVEGDSEVDRNGNGWYCQILVSTCAGELCKPTVVAEVDDHPTPPEKLTPRG